MKYLRSDAQQVHAKPGWVRRSLRSHRVCSAPAAGFAGESVTHTLGRAVRHATLPARAIRLLPTIFKITNDEREFFNNHQCCYQKFWPDEEFEYKITMLGPVDLHAVTVGLRNLVGTPNLPGTIWDYRDDYQLWDFNNHIFDVTGPPQEAGYISFIPDSSGTVIVKRKWFTDNFPRRREARWRGMSIPITIDSFENYTRSHVGGDIRFLGSF